MRKTIALLLTLLLLLSLAACGGSDSEDPDDSPAGSQSQTGNPSSEPAPDAPAGDVPEPAAEPAEPKPDAAPESAEPAAAGEPDASQGAESAPEPAPQPAYVPLPALWPPVVTEEADLAIYACTAFNIPVPKEYLDLLVIEHDPDESSGHRQTLLSFSEKASVEAGQLDYPGENMGFGWICSIDRLDRVGFEEWLSTDGTGAELFARDADYYYVQGVPTDVRFYRAGGEIGPDSEGLEDYDKLMQWANNELLQNLFTANPGLEAYDARDLIGREYTYEGAHVSLAYEEAGSDFSFRTVFLLSQPAKQGEGGVWCVERVRYEYPDTPGSEYTQLVFPVSYGMDACAAEYFPALQEQCDSGVYPDLLTPEGAVNDYTRRLGWGNGLGLDPALLVPAD